MNKELENEEKRRRHRKVCFFAHRWGTSVFPFASFGFFSLPNKLTIYIKCNACFAIILFQMCQDIICSANSFWTGCVQYSGYAGVMNDSMVPVRFLRLWLGNQFWLVQCDKTSISILLPQYPVFVIITTILDASFAFYFQQMMIDYFEKKG